MNLPDLDPSLAASGERTEPCPESEDELLLRHALEHLRRSTAGQYQIVRELGRGGMAAVYLARDLSLERDVALKVMSPTLLVQPGMLDRFRHEARVVAGLKHPHLVTVFKVAEADGLHYLEMEYIRGRPLDEVLGDAEREGRRLGVPAIEAVLYQVGSALGYAHRRGIVHRDVKPSNIILSEDGAAVVTDFGIAKAIQGPRHTMTGLVVGTPAYMSPEQCVAGEITGAADQYALGALAYEMLAGAPPFTGPMVGVLWDHTHTPPPALRPLRPDCPPALEAAVRRMLAKAPAERFPDIETALSAFGGHPLADGDPVRAELARLARGGAGRAGDSRPGTPSTSGVPRPATVPPTRPHPWPGRGPSRWPPRVAVGGAAAASLALLSVIATVLLDGRRQVRGRDASGGPAPAAEHRQAASRTSVAEGTPPADVRTRLTGLEALLTSGRQLAERGEYAEASALLTRVADTLAALNRTHAGTPGLADMWERLNGVRQRTRAACELDAQFLQRRGLPAPRCQ